MYVSKLQASIYKVMLLSLASKSEKEIINEYEKWDEAKARVLYFQILYEIKQAIAVNNIDDLKKFCKLIAVASNVTNKVTLKSYYDSDENPIKNTNLIILSCKYNNVEALKYVFDNKNKILDNLSVDIEVCFAQPDDEDDECHNSFYYAICSNNVELLNVLIKKWPNHYFDTRLDELDKILSKSYEETKLKNILLLGEMEFFVENKLITPRLFTTDTNDLKHSFDNVKARIGLLLEIVKELERDFLEQGDIGEKNVFSIKFIAQSIHILKRQLKPTYALFPWEELEFCLNTFIKSQMIPKEMNVVHNSILTKKRILDHLHHFSIRLDSVGIKESDVSKKLLDINREAIVNKIGDEYPPFKELYNDYEAVVNIYSLEKLAVYIDLALKSNPKQGNDRLVIRRALQIIGEYLKNTLESPKLSSTIGEFLLATAPTNLRKVLRELRNSLAHDNSFSAGSEEQFDFFSNLQNDLKKMHTIVINVLFHSKIKVYRKLLGCILDSTNVQEIKEMFQKFSYIRTGELIPGSFDSFLKSVDWTKIMELIETLDKIIGWKTDYERAMFDIIYGVTSIAAKNETRGDIIGHEIFLGLKDCGILATAMRADNISNKGIIQLFAKGMLEYISPIIKHQELKEVAEIVLNILRTVRPRLQPHVVDEIDGLVSEIFYVAEFQVDDFKWIECQREKLAEIKLIKPMSDSKLKRKEDDNVPKESWNAQLKTTLSTLGSVLNSNGLNNDLIKNYLSYKNNKKLQAVVEILVQDIISILENRERNTLSDNLLFSEDSFPLLIGKALSEYLRYGSAVIDVLSFDPSTAILSVARKLSSETMTAGNKAPLDTLPKDVPSKLKEKYCQDLQLIVNQEAMFKALEEGDLKTAENCIKKGADINARNVNLWTVLHFAAKGPNLEVVKFISRQNLISRTIDGQSPLHIAASHGRKTIVEYFIKEKGFNVNHLNNNNETPLHLAVQNGYKDVVEFLLKAGTEICSNNTAGLSPVIYAISNNHKDVLMVLLEKAKSVDSGLAVGVFLTPLHLAAEIGYLEIVHFLIQNNANVNAKAACNRVPLHGAALNGHFEVVQTLILNGADVMAKTLVYHRTPLDYAVENGHENVAKLLLVHGADVNATDNVFYTVPLHRAAKDGYIGIVEILLKYKCKVNIVNVDKMTALHFAATVGHKEIVDLLIKSNASVTAKNVHGFTALHLSSLQGHRDIVELLIKRGANIHAEDKRKRTPLLLAGMSGHKDIVELLISSGANVNAVDINYSTTLHVCCVNSYKDIVEVLVKKGAKIEAKNIYGCTPLHLVAGDSLTHEIVKIILQNSTVNPTIPYIYKENYKPTDNTSINVKAKSIANRKIIKILLDNGANVHAKCKFDFTPLHLAALNGRAETVETLISGKANVNVRGHGITPLHATVYGNHKEVTEILLKHGCNVNAKDDDDHSPLFHAVRVNFKELVKLLIEKGADVTENLCLLRTVNVGFQNIAENLLRTENISTQPPKNAVMLHLAAVKGFTGIVEVLIANGSNVNAATDNGYTTLHLAALGGHEEVVKVLLAKKANLNPWGDQCGTPLHIACAEGHCDVVELLLSSGANIDIKDNGNITTAMEVATHYGHLQVVKKLLQYEGINVIAKGFINATGLHIASNKGHLEIIKYLIHAGADVDAKDAAGSKPMHIAAMKGHVPIVEFFLANGCQINDSDEAGWTMLHHAIGNGQVEVVKHLVKQTVDINPASGIKPLHLAIIQDYRDIVRILLKNGAMYNDVNEYGKKPIDLAKSPSVAMLLVSIENLFKAVSGNRPSDVEMHVKGGAFVDAKSSANVTSLHYASWKGYKEVVDMLLKHQANPNITGKGGCTPLHYAAKFSHLDIVKVLLSNGAKFNVLSRGFKTPADFASDHRIIDLLKLVEQLFKKIQICEPKVTDDLKQIKDTDVMKPILNARNRDGNTIMVAAIRNDFPKIETLKKIFEEDDYTAIQAAMMLLSQGKYPAALRDFHSLFIRRKELLGQDNPCTLKVQCYVAEVLSKQKNHTEALSMLQEIHEKQEAMLGRNNKDTLHTRKCIALVFCEQGQDEKALEIYEEVFREQKEKLGAGDPDTLDTRVGMYLLLSKLERYDEALHINYEMLEKHRETMGASHPLTLSVQDDIASLLSNQEKYDEALKAFKEVFELRKRILGSDHLNTLKTQAGIANVLFQQGKFVSALQTFKDCFDRRLAVLGPVHPSILDTSFKMEMINFSLKMKGYDGVEVLTHIRKVFFVAVGKGDIKVIQKLINEGVDVSARNSDNRTPLHVAANYGHEDVVRILLNNGADVTEVANKGNTVLHLATSQGNIRIVEILLQHMKQANRDKYGDFLNARTAIAGSTSLHIAVRRGFFEIVICLLKHGAIYNAVDKANKTPLDFSENENIQNLLSLTNQLFECAEKGCNSVVNKLNQINSEEFASIINAQNAHGQTAIDIALRNNNITFVNMIIRVMQDKSI